MELKDLRVAAQVMDKKRVREEVELVIQPASMRIYKKAKQEGLTKIFEKAGGQVILPACGACIGQGKGKVEEGEVVISTYSRNYKGRMGLGDAYLATPSVAASAIAGYITAP